MRYGSAVIAAMAKGSGEVSRAGSTEWCQGLTRGDSQVETITRNVLNRFPEYPARSCAGLRVPTPLMVLPGDLISFGGMRYPPRTTARSPLERRGSTRLLIPASGQVSTQEPPS